MLTSTRKTRSRKEHRDTAASAASPMKHSKTKPIFYTNFLTAASYNKREKFIHTACVIPNVVKGRVVKINYTDVILDLKCAACRAATHSSSAPDFWVIPF
mmetsp:Transcript_8529/g.12905  ORF Transcript_8529/g.12905 Transcript_8529/m.12905 type:complete len:100 (+) Transcript_8529:101-400(+)